MDENVVKGRLEFLDGLEGDTVALRPFDDAGHDHAGVLDDDLDVDQADLLIFLDCLSGEGVTPPESCLNSPS